MTCFDNQKVDARYFDGPKPVPLQMYMLGHSSRGPAKNVVALTRSDYLLQVNRFEQTYMYKPHHAVQHTYGGLSWLALYRTIYAEAGWTTGTYLVSYRPSVTKYKFEWSTLYVYDVQGTTTMNVYGRQGRRKITLVLYVGVNIATNRCN